MARMQQHKNRLPGGSLFVKKYAIDRLVFYENFDGVHEAIAHEKRLKKWRRDWKIRLVETVNPNWDDLSKNWHGLDEIR